MSRLEQTNTNSINSQDTSNDSNTESIEIVYNKIVLNKPSEYDSTERILLIDSDSILFMASYFPEDSLEEFPTDELQLEEGKFRIRNKIEEIQSSIEEHYNIKQTLLFLGGKGNFRYKLYPAYKANRKDKEISPLIPLLKKYMVNELPNVIESHGAEADDYVFETYKMTEGNCVCCSIDKDIFYNCHSVPLFDYRSYKSKDLENTTIIGNFKVVTEKQSRLAKAQHIVVGDVSDGVPGAKGVGPAWCEKNMHEDMTDYQFTKQVFLAYLKANKNDAIESKKQIKLFYKLLKLWTKDELKSLNL